MVVIYCPVVCGTVHLLQCSPGHDWFGDFHPAQLDHQDAPEYNGIHSLSCCGTGH